MSFSPSPSSLWNLPRCMRGFHPAPCLMSEPPKGAGGRSPRRESRPHPVRSPGKPSSHLTCASFFPGSPDLQSPPPPSCPPPPALASQGGRLPKPKPKPSLAPFSGAGAAAEFRWNFEVVKHLGKERERKGETGGGESAPGASTCRTLEGAGGLRARGRGSRRLPTSALQNACCGCTGEQLQASAGRSSVASSRRPSASRRLWAAAPMAGRGRRAGAPAVAALGGGLGAGRGRRTLLTCPCARANFLCSLSRAARAGRGGSGRAEKKAGRRRRRPGSAPRLPSMDVFAAGSARAGRFIALRGSSAPPLGGWRPVQAGAPSTPPPAPPAPPRPSPEPRLCCAQPGTAGLPHHPPRALTRRCAPGTHRLGRTARPPCSPRPPNGRIRGVWWALSRT